MTYPPEPMENTWKIFQLFRKIFFRPPPPPSRSANRISTATTNHRSEPGFTLSTLSEETHKSLLARTHTPSTRYRGPVFCSRLPWLRETRPNQVETGHLFENKFSDGHSLSIHEVFVRRRAGESKTFSNDRVPTHLGSANQVSHSSYHRSVTQDSRL